jgi:outer membrane cobalamin receptor
MQVQRQATAKHLTLLLFLLTMVEVKVQAQEMVNERFYRITLTQALSTIAKKHYIHVAYNPALTDKEMVNLTIADKSIEEALVLLTRSTRFSVQKVEARSYIVRERGTSGEGAPQKKKKKCTISGYVSQEGSGEKLVAASVAIEGKAVGTTSNEFGFYSLTLEEGSYSVVFSFVGYQPIVRKVDLSENRLLNVTLSQGQQLQEVVITQKKENEIHFSPQMSLNAISIEQVKNTPVLFGEADVLKTIQLLPGIKSGGEGCSGIYVRGGSSDQNLMLLDGVSVYNVSHMLGFFSVFNADAINSTQILKGGFPARYGERLSSVVDIRMKEGNLQKHEGEVAIGLISSKISLSGPIVRDRTSFVVSARRTYADLLLKGLLVLSKTDDNAEVYFYDINAKVNHKFSDNDRLYLSVYNGRDYVDVKSEDTYGDNARAAIDKQNVNINWGNTIGALRWNHIFSPKLFANTTASYTRYDFSMDVRYDNVETPPNTPSTTDRYTSKSVSGIDDVSGKIDFDYYPSAAHTVKFGASATYHTFTPSADETSQINGNDPSLNETQSCYKKIRAKEAALYAEDTYSMSRIFSLNAGIRGSLFMVNGISYRSIEPRLALNARTSETSSIKLSYVQMTQYLHFLSLVSMALPNDLWVPTTRKVKPEHSKQVALGATKSVGKYTFTVETYYKLMNKIIEYKDGAAFKPNDADWENKVTEGKGTGYGAEFMAEKRDGRLTGWFSYTLSWANRQFKELNGGRTFPFSYDRRHDLSLTIGYKLSPRVDFGATWVYNTGRAFTLGTETYTPYNSDIDNAQDSPLITNNCKKNNIRLPDYHRLDLGINFRKKKKWGERTWSVSVYNAYNRHNTFFVYPNEEKVALKSISLFSIIPSISYSYKF